MSCAIVVVGVVIVIVVGGGGRFIIVVCVCVCVHFSMQQHNTTTKTIQQHNTTQHTQTQHNNTGIRRGQTKSRQDEEGVEEGEVYVVVVLCVILLFVVM